MRFGSLFAGIGGLDLGLERAGMECAFQVEWADFPIKVLEKHWPNVPRWRDIREVNTDELPPIDLLCGGFPCQPHSLAGKRLASEDERDLWDEYARIIRGTRPRWIVAENVTGLLSSENGRYFGRVLRDLAQLGFDAEWCVLSAAGMGAPHLRRRVFLVAYANGQGQLQQEGADGQERGRAGDGGQAVADADRLGRQGRPRVFRPEWGRELTDGSWWIAEPDVGRVVDGVSPVLDRGPRIEGLGNAVVPACAEYVGRLISLAECA